MWTDNIILKFILYLVVVVSVSMMPEILMAQPYYYFFKPTTDRGEADIHRVNLRTGVSDLFLPNAGRILQVFWNSDQTKLFVQNRSVLDIIDANNPSETKRLLDPVDWVQDVLDAPQINRVFVSIAPEDIDYENSNTIIFNRTTYEPVDTLPQFLSYNKPFFSADQRKVYKLIPNSTGLYFRTIDAFSGVTFQERRYGNLGPFPFAPSLSDGRNARALIKFHELHNPDPANYLSFEHQHYVVCDPELGVTYQPIPFPWRSQGRLSSSAQYIILEQVNFDRTKESVEYRPGIVYVFDAMTGKIMQRLSLPPEGNILIFENYPEMLYYYIPETQQSISVNVTTVMPTAVLLDTLIALKHQAVSKGWFIDRKEKDEDDEEEDGSIVKQLDKRLDKAQKELVKGDSAKARKELRKFIKKVEELYKESQDHEKKHEEDKIILTSEGYALLKYNAEYLIDRLQKKGEKKDDDKDKD